MKLDGQAAAETGAVLHLRYRGKLSVHLRGEATGRLYRFSPVQPVQPVDPRDARALLLTPLFRVSA
jgi:hypothetical protein